MENAGNVLSVTRERPWGNWLQNWEGRVLLMERSGSSANAWSTSTPGSRELDGLFLLNSGKRGESAVHFPEKEKRKIGGGGTGGGGGKAILKGGTSADRRAVLTLRRTSKGEKRPIVSDKKEEVRRRTG